MDLSAIIPLYLVAPTTPSLSQPLNTVTLAATLATITLLSILVV